MERAEASVADAGATPRGSLKVTAPLGFGRRVLSAMSGRFHASYPHIDLRLRLSDHLLDLLNESIDIAVRMAPLQDSSLIVRKIADVERVLCASPAYLERRGTPQIPADLADHDCLLLRYPGSTQSRWPLTIGGIVTEQIVTGSL